MESKLGPRVLICDDDQLFHLAVKHCLKGKCTITSAMNGDEALAILQKQSLDVVLLDVAIRTEKEGLEFIPKLLAADPDLAIIMTSGNTEFEVVKEAMRLGATDYVAKDFDPNDLIHVILKAIEHKSLIRRTQQQNFEVRQTQGKHVLIGESTPVTKLREMIERLKVSRANVLITGETGTGKEVVARQIRRTLKDGTLEPFVAVDSSTIQGTMAESALFGHEKGAFTGADKTTKGIFEEADGGIVYFDEIGNMPIEIQSKLLRVLQEKEISRVGSSKPIPLEFRVVCATNLNLDEAVRTGQFKHDLLQRICVLPIELPPLRERAEDIPLLISHFLQKHQINLRLTPEATVVLQSYPWPGNIRELENIITYLGAMCSTDDVDVCDLPAKFKDVKPGAAGTKGLSSVPGTEVQDPTQLSFYDQVALFEKQLLEKKYEEEKGNIKKLSLELKMDRSHLYSKLKSYGIHIPQKE